MTAVKNTSQTTARVDSKSCIPLVDLPRRWSARHTSPRLVSFSWGAVYPSWGRR